eukprot:s122_g2.t1
MQFETGQAPVAFPKRCPGCARPTQMLDSFRDLFTTFVRLLLRLWDSLPGSDFGCLSCRWVQILADRPLDAAWWCLKGHEVDQRTVLLWLPGGAFLAQQPTAWLFARRLLPQLATTAAAVPRVLEMRLRDRTWLGNALEIELKYSLPTNPSTTLQQARAAVQWLKSQGCRVILAGDSAGGYICIQALLAEDMPGVLGGVALCPWLDFTFSGASHRAARCFLQQRWLEGARDEFLGSADLEVAKKWSLCFSLTAAQQQKLRDLKLLVVSCDLDLVHSDAKRFAQLADTVQYLEVAGFHDALLLPVFHDPSHQRAFEQIADFVQKMLKG